ncbi:MAG TPA: thioredoxin family protein [Candidatus Kapabacteria bacterium]|nr:thioredoxin family protein [Candidatus Kapabacteria bacterium]
MRSGAIRYISALLLLHFALLVRAQFDDAAQTTVKLLLSHETARPGETITAAIEVTSNPHWHTYWRNPGDAGLATSIEWELPPGFKAGPIQWPVPQKTELLQLGSYAYEGTRSLLIPITVDATAQVGTAQIKGRVSWLECEKTCNPRNAEVQGVITVGADSKASSVAAVIENARKELPPANAALAVKASWENTANPKKRTLAIEWTSEVATKNPDFYPYESEKYTVQTATRVDSTEKPVRIRKEVTLGDDVPNWPTTLAGLLVNDSKAKNPIAFEISLSPVDLAKPGAAGSTTSTIANPRAELPTVTASLWTVLGLAFLGGLILNIMPCVLPVIALKILSFVNQSGSDTRRVRQLGLVYALGVLVSFAVLAGIIIGVQKAGGIASWGMQYQNPIFLVVMVTLVTLIALNLFGVFEITLGGKALGGASELASREGTSGAFFNGVLATVLGTSCTAPFLAFAIGYAIGQPSLVTILIFLTMGVGLAFPYVVLTWNPALLKVLPKPGAWMERFKVAMGFPMLATAIWLYGVAVKAHFGVNGAFWLAIFLVLVGLSAWIFGTFIQRGVKRRGLATVFALGAMAFAVAFVLEKQLSWRKPVYARTDNALHANASGVNWQKWSPDAVAKARAEGRPILVDFTADWCLNCQANKISSIEIDSVEKKLQEIKAVAMLADFTRSDPVIAEELRRFKRSAVPLVLVYSADPSEPPRVLPELLTPGIVLEALDWAGRNKAKSAAPAQDKLAAKQ